MTPERAGQVCDELDRGLRGSEVNLTAVANTIVVVLRDEAWRERRIRTGEIVRCESFLELLTAPPLRGYGEDPKRVEALLKDDTEALRMFRVAITPKKGKRAKAEVNTSNRSIKPQHGTTRAYTLTRLEKEAPAFYQRVVAGELSAHAAAKAAGIVHDKTTFQQLQHWWQKATADEHQAFLEWVNALPGRSTSRAS
jgi:hypothetical protein